MPSILIKSIYYEPHGLKAYQLSIKMSKYSWRVYLQLIMAGKGQDWQ
jgi:hypothetical protein